MALNFPDSPTNGQKYTDATTGETWTYEASTNSWASDGLTTAAGIQYKGGIDITAAPPAGAANGWQYTVTTGGTANAGFTGLTGIIPAGATVLYDGTNWQQAGAGGLADAPDGATDGTRRYVRQVVRTGTINAKTWAEVSVATASRTQAGIAEIATESEITTGTDDVRFISPKGAKTTLMPYNISLLTALP